MANRPTAYKDPFQADTTLQPLMEQNVSKSLHCLCQFHGTLQDPVSSLCRRLTESKCRESLLTFLPTKVSRDIQSENGQPAHPKLHVACEHGFFQVDGDCVCYRRNYFTIEASFSSGLDNLGALYFHAEDNSRAEIDQFRLCISAVTDSGDVLTLVQHDAKMDGGHVHDPEPCTVTPMTKDQSLLPKLRQNNFFSPWPSQDVERRPFVARFPRLQFRNATANNGKRRANQQYFHLVLGLIAETRHSVESQILVATRKSQGIVVRGRSPGHYHEHDSSSSSAPNRAMLVNDNPPAPIGPSSTHREASSIHSPANLPEFHALPNMPASSVKVSPASDEPAAENPALIEDIDDQKSENSSISSMAFSSRHSMSSKPTTAPRDDSTYQLVDLLLEDKGLQALCTDGFTYLDVDRFERNLRRLLKILLRALRQNNPLITRHSIRAHFEYRHVKSLATSIRNRLVTRHSDHSQHWMNLVHVKVDKKPLLRQYLHEISSDLEHLPITIDQLRDKSANADLPGSELESSGSDHSSDASVTGEQSESLQDFKELVFKTNEWWDFKEGLIGFIVPIMVAMREARYATETTELELDHDDQVSPNVLPTDPLWISTRHANTICQILMDGCKSIV
ncbi:MAG: hypothetical protein Q9200_004699 [Gallowayella weberi]